MLNGTLIPGFVVVYGQRIVNRIQCIIRSIIFEYRVKHESVGFNDIEQTSITKKDNFVKGKDGVELYL